MASVSTNYINREQQTGMGIVNFVEEVKETNSELVKHLVSCASNKINDKYIKDHFISSDEDLFNNYETFLQELKEKESLVFTCFFMNKNNPEHWNQVVQVKKTTNKEINTPDTTQAYEIISERVTGAVFERYCFFVPQKVWNKASDPKMTPSQFMGGSGIVEYTGYSSARSFRWGESEVVQVSHCVLEKPNSGFPLEIFDPKDFNAEFAENIEPVDNTNFVDETGSNTGSVKDDHPVDNTNFVDETGSNADSVKDDHPVDNTDFVDETGSNADSVKSDNPVDNTDFVNETGSNTDSVKSDNPVNSTGIDSLIYELYRNANDLPDPNSETDYL